MFFIKNNIILDDKYLTIPKNRSYITISDIYDVIRIYNGKIFDFEQHFERLSLMLTKSNNKIGTIIKFMREKTHYFNGKMIARKYID